MDTMMKEYVHIMEAKIPASPSQPNQEGAVRKIYYAAVYRLGNFLFDMGGKLLQHVPYAPIGDNIRGCRNMPLPTRECRVCGETFTLTPNKPGLITDCPACAKEVVKPFYALVEQRSKNSCEAEIHLTQDATYARHFNGAQTRRGGTGVNSSFLHGVKK